MGNWLKKGAGFAVGMATLAAGLIVPMTAQAADAQPLIHYSFDSASASKTIANEGTAANSDATLTGDATTANGSISLTGSQTIEVPTAAIKDQKDLTVSIWLKNNYGNGNVAAAYIGNGATKNGYFLLNPANPKGYVKSVMTTATAASPNNSPWGTEVGPGATNAAETGSKATSDMALYTTVIDGTNKTMSFYLNGAPVGDATYAIPEGGLTSYGDLKAYIGKSSYADPNTKIDVDDYAVYGSALTAADVTALYDAQALDKAAAAVKGSVPSTASEDFTLPTAAAGATVAWKVTKGDAIAVDAATGKVTVTRPAADAADASVTLTATFTAGSATKTVDYVVTVPRQLSDEELAQADLDAITIESSDDVRSNISLPILGSENGSAVSWAVTDGADIATVGAADPSGRFATLTVKRPAAGSKAATVKLTATVKHGAATLTSKPYTLTVQPMPAADQKDAAYVWAFFTGEGVGGEKISLAASKGNDALDWNTLNNGTPLFTSTFGEQGLRDPFIIRSHDGDKFYMLATDLKISGRPGSFDSAQRNGSKYIEVWKSDDLVTWTPQSHVKVSSDYAGNTWAPEAYWDSAIGKYVVYWASNMYDTTDNSLSVRTHVTYNQMMYVTTDDFVNFSDPKAWVNVNQGQGKGMIDATIAEENGVYYRFYKDESQMQIREEKSTDLLATIGTDSTPGTLPKTTGQAASDQWTLVKEKIGVGQNNQYGGTFSQGEGPSVFPANEGDVNGVNWYLFLDQPSYHGGPNHYIAFDVNDLNTGDVTAVKYKNLPTNSDGGKPRHGTVVPVTRAQYQKVLEAYAPAIAVKTVDALAATTEVGVAPTLPAKAHLTHVDGSEADADVVWDEVPASAYAQAGTFTVKGVAQDDSRMPVEATVTVAAPASADASLKSLSVGGVAVSVADAEAGKASVEVADPAKVGEANVEAVANDAKASKPVVAVKDGVVTVTVTAEDGTTQKVYKVALVKKAPVVVPVASVKVSVDKSELTVGETAQAKATVAPADATDKAVSWKSSDGKVATVDKSGKVVAVAPGTVEITATVGGKSGKVSVTVKTKPETKPTPKPSWRFTDVTAATPHAADIQWLADEGISTGWATGENTAVFSPMGPVVRQDMAAFLYRLAGSPEFTPSAEDKARFTDVTDATPHAKEIWWLASTGIAEGFRNADGSFSFGGMRVVVRQDMAAFLKRLADYRKADPALGEGVAFTDVDAATPHAGEIGWLARTGVAAGFPDGTFGGMRLVVRQDMAAFLHRMDTNVLK